MKGDRIKMSRKERRGRQHFLNLHLKYCAGELDFVESDGRAQYKIICKQCGATCLAYGQRDSDFVWYLPENFFGENKREAPLDPQRKCKSCGAPVTPRDVQCQRCGNFVKQPKTGSGEFKTLKETLIAPSKVGRAFH